MATYWENSCSFGLRYVSWYKYLIVSLVFSHLGFWSGNLFLIAPFPDLCLLVPFYARCVCYTRLVNHAASLARVRGSITGFTFISFLTFSHLELNIILKKKATLEISRVMSVSNKNETSCMYKQM